MEKTIEKLAKEVERLAATGEKQASVWWTFLRGTMMGLGFFIGSAILATGLIYLLSKLQGWGELGNFLHQIIEDSGKNKP